MARKLLGSVPAQNCELIAVFLAPEVAAEIRRRAKLRGVGAGRVVSWLVEPAIQRDLEAQAEASVTHPTEHAKDGC